MPTYLPKKGQELCQCNVCQFLERFNTKKFIHRRVYLNQQIDVDCYNVFSVGVHLSTLYNVIPF